MGNVTPLVVVGLSGGVDSAVSSYLLKQAGYKVLCVFMQNWEADHNQFCTIKQDAIDAIAVADCLGLDIEIVNFANEYKKLVFSNFITEYKNGRTPNPDVLCNSEIKFKVFLEYALSIGADYIATGHYAKISPANEKLLLQCALDNSKDQSYFLYRLNQLQLSKTIFPLANLLKSEVRQIAADISLPNAHKRDSTGICFIGKQPFRNFLTKYCDISPGNIVNENGNILGEHIGLMYYTIGQRKGIGIGGKGSAWYVARKDLKSNTLIVVQDPNHEMLLSTTINVDQLSFISGNIPENGKYTAKIRYRMSSVLCTLSKYEQSIELTFDTPQRAVTAGQSVVIYDINRNTCLGGGIITNNHPKQSTDNITDCVAHVK